MMLTEVCKEDYDVIKFNHFIYNDGDMLIVFLSLEN